MRLQLCLSLVLMSLWQCAVSKPDSIAMSTYEKQIRDWHQTRNDRLNQPDGWLTLAGLYWLAPGANSFGSDNSNQIIFPGRGTPGFMGTLSLDGDSVSIEVANNVEIINDGNPIRQSGLKKDSSGEPDILSWGSLSWYIIQRGDRIGVRLRDSNHPNYMHFKPTELFPIDSSWRVLANLEPFDSSTTVDIVNVLGDTSPNATPGILHFEINGHKLSLTPLADPGDENYFVIFGDKTNGITTYGAGRFLVVPAVNESGKTYIDFNQAYNMPCAFSPWATCPLPPEENVLDISIEAGELAYEVEGGH